MGDGDDNARKRRREKLKDMLQKLEVSHQVLLRFFSFPPFHFCKILSTAAIYGVQFSCTEFAQGFDGNRKPQVIPNSCIFN